MPGLHSGSGKKRIQAERLRQINEEGWTNEHDDRHYPGELTQAGLGYTGKWVNSATSRPTNWPWNSKWWKPSDDRVRNLEKGGALIQAEIDKLIRIRGEIAQIIDDLLDEGPDVKIR